jgi:hypothetical protein
MITMHEKLVTSVPGVDYIQFITAGETGDHHLHQQDRPACAGVEAAAPGKL